ncbi:hypothetical protein GCM10025881_06850 [Pseudolysinimonas kribbensis]|uniref:DUF5666 domain-containing protein n=1 Tax=Pseudolysinimonas kribbensis TaxID=433641 RepID=A0ABQ6K523_9MICO|nr:hypothetical protein [Pseudolysinimonas kribbensis]GMA93861.1 hypothetical protein GCM10025881_06850 [Pseudolysinimonas kribbensis]
MPRRPLVALAVSAALVLSALSACAPASSRTAPPDGAPEHARFGAPAKPDGRTLQLQDDVVTVGGGRNAVWGASSDGTTWTLDGNAPGMDKLAVDKILLATGYATGRVVQITRHGDKTDVVLAPIALTDLVKNGEVRFDQDVKPDQLQVQGFDGGTVQDAKPRADGSIAPTAYVRRADRPDPADPLADKPLPVPAKEFSHETEDWKLSGGTARDGLHFSVETEAAGLKVFGTATLLFDALHINLGTVIANSIAGGATGRVSGIQGVRVDLQAGSQNKGGSTIKKEFKLPFEIPVQTLIGGVPVFAKFTTAVTVDAGLVGTDATITGAGEWHLGAPLSMSINGQAVNSDTSQDLKVVHSIMDSISGIALGGAVFNLGFKVTMMTGIGAPTSAPVSSRRSSSPSASGSAPRSGRRSRCADRRATTWRSAPATAS